MQRQSLLALVLIAGLQRAQASETLVVHEWGTFTSFQDERGEALGGLNVDDEPVPDFVHDAVPGLLTRLNDGFPQFSKGVPAGDPEVTMRLETPVLYFHPATAQSRVTVDVHVDFHGGWLTQYFPDATATRPGAMNGTHFVFAPLAANTLSSLQWRGLQVGGPATGVPGSTSTVWLAPRQVAAADIQAGTEGERFLFYRGVGHVDAPVRVVRDGQGSLTVHVAAGVGDITRFVLVDIRPDGQLAFRIVDGQGARTIAAGSERFGERAYSLAHLADLRRELQQGLTSWGLFADEAAALLNTWESSYFRNPGLRLFFLVPRDWVDRVLPLSIVPRAEVERAMVGRIEIISPRSREALAAIASSPRSQKNWWRDFLMSRVYEPGPDGKPVYRVGGAALQHAVTSQPGAFARYQIAVPADYAAYLSLGRFRDALLHWQLDRHPDPALRAFARTYDLISPFDLAPGETLDFGALTAPTLPGP
jgi:hypothetical protein